MAKRKMLGKLASFEVVMGKKGVADKPDLFPCSVHNQKVIRVKYPVHASETYRAPAAVAPQTLGLLL